MLSFLFSRKEEYPDYGTIEPKGYRTTCPREEMSSDDWNDHMEYMFNRARSMNILHTSEIRHQNIRNPRLNGELV